MVWARIITVKYLVRVVPAHDEVFEDEARHFLIPLRTYISAIQHIN